MITSFTERTARGLLLPRSTPRGEQRERWLERALLVAVVLVASCTAWLVSTAPHASGEAAPLPPACVTAAVDRVQDFAGVLGDHRPVDSTFAERECGGAAALR